MKILARNDNVSMTLNPGDTLSLYHKVVDQFGNLVSSTRVLRQEITEQVTYDTALVVEVKPGELGLECGIGGVFGKRIKR